MFKWIGYLKYLTAVIPLVNALIEAVETPGMGEEKKATVMKGIKKALENLHAPKAAADMVLGFCDWFIDTIVWIKNVAGHFLH